MVATNRIVLKSDDGNGSEMTILNRGASVKVRVLVGMVLVAAFGFGFGYLVDVSTRPAVIRVEALETYTFPSLPRLLATSDVAVFGRVTSTEPGRVIHDGEESFLQFRNVIVEVEKAFGSVATPGQVIIEEQAWDTGMPVIFEGMQPSRVGDEGFFFLLERDDPVGTYDYISSQGRYLVDGDRLRGADPDTAGHPDPLVERVEAMSRVDLEAALAKSSRMIARGQVEPCSSTGC